MERHVHPSVRSNAHISGHPIHPMLIPFPIALLIGAFVTDLVYVFSGDSFWIVMSFWLIVAGVAMALLAAIPGAIDLFTIDLARQHPEAWVHAGGNLLAVLLAVANLGLRIPGPVLSGATLTGGVVLSGLVAGILVVTGWLGGELAHRHGIGVLPTQAEIAPAGEERRRAA